MKLKLFFIIAIFNCWFSLAQPAIDFNEVSEEFLLALQGDRTTEEYERLLRETNLETLEFALNSDNKKLAFWVNIYNAFIQKILQENPELYKDRRSFFSSDLIPIAGRTLSFAKIEHGLIRKSQWELGLGYIRKWFPDKFERKLRVDHRDYRIHFALNCGAEDCPPVAIYTPARLDEQFAKGTRMYVQRTSTYFKEKDEVAVTSLFNWFRGDFGGKNGVKKILLEQGIIPDKKVGLKYTNYNWSLKLNNYIKL